jgi:hypothetical protein
LYNKEGFFGFNSGRGGDVEEWSSEGVTQYSNVGEGCNNTPMVERGVTILRWWRGV